MSAATPIDMRGTIELTDRASPTIARVQRSLQGFAARSGLSRIATGFSGVSASVGKLVKVAGPATAVLGGLTAAAGVAAVGRMVSTWGAAGDELAKFSRQVGIAAGEMQELRFVAERQGVSQQQLDMAMKQVTRRMGELRSGQGSLKAYLDKTNPALARQLEATEGTGAAMGVMLGALAGVEDPMRRAALAAQLFGEEGTIMTRVAEAGRDGIADLRAEFARLYGTRTEMDFTWAEKWQDSLSNLRLAGRGLSDMIGAKLIPVMSPLVDKLTNWIAANRELLSQKIGDAVIKIAKALETINLDETVKGIETAAMSIGGFVDMIGGFKVALAGIAAVMAAPFVSAVIQVGVAVAKLGMIIATTPIGWIVAAVAAGAYLVYRAWDDVSGRLEAIWSGIAKVGQGLADWFDAVLVGDWASAADAIYRINDGIGEAFTNLWGMVGDIAMEGLRVVDEMLGTDLAGSVERGLALVRGAAEGFTDWMSGWGDTIDGILERITGFFSAAWDKIGSVISSIGSGIRKVGQWVGISSDGAEAAGSAGGAVKGYASGGRFSAGQLFQVGERGTELMQFGQPGQVFRNGDFQAFERGAGLLERALRAGAAGGGMRPAAPARSEARLEVTFPNAPRGTQASYKETGAPLFSNVSLNTGPSMRRGGG